MLKIVEPIRKTIHGNKIKKLLAKLSAKIRETQNRKNIITLNLNIKSK